MKIKIKVKDRSLSAVLNDSDTAKDFASLLPLTLTMNDLFRREKYGRLPRAISEQGDQTHHYDVGDLAYWSPGPDLAVFYRHDGQKIPPPGIIILGKLESGLEELQAPGVLKVTIELIDDVTD